MTKGDKIKLRAELAGKATIGLLSGEYREATEQQAKIVAKHAVQQADAVMAELGLSLDKEDHPAYDPS